MPFRLPTLYCGWGFPGGASGKEPPAEAGDGGLIPGSGRSPGGAHQMHSNIEYRVPIILAAEMEKRL